MTLCSLPHSCKEYTNCQPQVTGARWSDRWCDSWWKKNAKYYWATLRERNSNLPRNSNKLSLENCFKGFKELAGNESHGEYTGDPNEKDENLDVDETTEEVADRILNCQFTVDEIYSEIKNLKNGKACGTDKILNEFLKASFNEMKDIYVTLFNRVLNEGQIPES